MRYVHIENVEPGQYLGRTIFSGNGAVLLSEVRFWNNDVLTQTEAVLAAIHLEFARGRATPALSRERERGFRG